MENNNKIAQIITELEAFIIKSKRKPFTKDKIIVDEQQLLGYITRLREETVFHSNHFSNRASGAVRRSQNELSKDISDNDDSYKDYDDYKDYDYYDDYNDYDVTKPKLEMSSQNQRKLKLEMPKLEKPKLEMPKLERSKSKASRIKKVETKHTPSAAERVHVWPYSVPSQDEFFNKKHNVYDILRELGAVQYDKDTYEYNDMYFRLDEILFKQKPFIVIKYAEDEEDLQQELFFDIDPFPYDLSIEELKIRVKSNLDMVT